MKVYKAETPTLPAYAREILLLQFYQLRILPISVAGNSRRGKEMMLLLLDR
jgi:hypothetical protein